MTYTAMIAELEAAIASAQATLARLQGDQPDEQPELPAAVAADTSRVSAWEAGKAKARRRHAARFEDAGTSTSTDKAPESQAEIGRAKARERAARRRPGGAA